MCTCCPRRSLRLAKNLTVIDTYALLLATGITLLESHDIQPQARDDGFCQGIGIHDVLPLCSLCPLWLKSCVALLLIPFGQTYFPMIGTGFNWTLVSSFVPPNGLGFVALGTTSGWAECGTISPQNS